MITQKDAKLHLTLELGFIGWASPPTSRNPRATHRFALCWPWKMIRRSKKKDYLNLSGGPIKKDGLSKIARETTNERQSNIARGEDKKRETI